MLLVNPIHLVHQIKKLSGFDQLEINDYFYLYQIAVDVTRDWSDDWDDDCGFGSSDKTYLMKAIVDDVIIKYGCDSQFKTDFTPCLSIVKI